MKSVGRLFIRNHKTHQRITYKITDLEVQRDLVLPVCRRTYATNISFKRWLVSGVDPGFLYDLFPPLKRATS